MNSYFKCYRCNNYKTDRKCNIITHLTKKFKCSKHPDIEHVTDIDIYNKSILRINEIPIDIKNKIIYNTGAPSETLPISHMCTECNKIFSTKYYTSRHFLKCKNK